MKKILTLIIVAVFAISVKAQENKVQLKAGVALAIPTGVLTLANNVGFGVVLDADVYNITDNLNLYAEASLLFFTAKGGFLGNSTTATHIPVLGGIRYKTNNFFVGLGLGYGYYNFGQGDTESGFSFSPHIGYSLEKFDIMFKYNSTTTSGLNANYVSIGGVYRFLIKNH